MLVYIEFNWYIYWPHVTGNDRLPGCASGRPVRTSFPVWRNPMVRLFDNKSRHHTGPSRSAESTYAFLDRSSLPEYEQVRNMLQRWIDRFPPEHERKIVGQMRHKGTGSRENDKAFYAAFFELFLHEFLTSTDELVEAQPAIGTRPPDFKVRVTLQDGTQLTYLVEATDINLESGTALERDQGELSVWDTLNEIPSPDF